MLQDIEVLEDQMLAVGLAFLNVIAYDPETQARLKSSRGRRREGRPTKYHVLAPSGKKYICTGLAPSVSMGQVCHFTAYTDEEAIAKANEMLPEKYRVFMEAVYKEEVIEI